LKFACLREAVSAKVGILIFELEVKRCGERDGKTIPLSYGLSKAADGVYSHLAHATGGSVYEGVSGAPEEIFFPGDV
jgi:hypothetical protein